MKVRQMAEIHRSLSREHPGLKIKIFLPDSLFLKILLQVLLVHKGVFYHGNSRAES